MPLIEPAALAIVALYVAARAYWGEEPRRFLWRLALLVVASWVAEDTCIEAYGFYAYNPAWSLFVHHVPLAIVLIWPVVIHSAWDLARHLLPTAAGATAAPLARPAVVALAGAGLVLADASLIEPIAVQAGLWWWTEPGLFGVPPIGLLGWAYHALACMLVLGRSRRARADLWVLPVAPAAAHLLLLATWWGALRWVNVPLPPWPFVAAAWLGAIALAAWAWRWRARERIPPRDMWTRVPAALFFLVLLASHGREVVPLVVYAVAFAPPYVALTRWPRREPQRAPAGQASASTSV